MNDYFKDVYLRGFISACISIFVPLFIWGNTIAHLPYFINKIEIGKVLIDSEYPFALIKYLDKNFDEKKNFQKAWKVSSLLTTFGKTAQIVMAAYGVGPDTAARILKNRLEDDDDYLIKQIIIAEKTYTLTRGFWKD